MSRVHCYRDIQCREKLIPPILKKLASLEYRHIENQDSADLIERVCPEIDKKVAAMYTKALNIISLVVYIAGIMVTLLIQIWWIGVILLISAVPLIYMAQKAGREVYEANRDVTKVYRRADYLSNALTNREAVEERSVFGYSKELNCQYGEKYEFYRRFRFMVGRRNFIRYKMVAMLSTVYPLMTMLMLIGPVINGYIKFRHVHCLDGSDFGVAKQVVSGGGTGN